MVLSFSEKTQSITICLFIIAIGLGVFKFIPMEIYGNDILFDASAHIAISVFILFVGWHFIDQNNSWRIPYLIFSLAIVVVVAVQRIFADEHNYFGILLGLIISLFGIVAARRDYFKGKFRF